MERDWLRPRMKLLKAYMGLISALSIINWIEVLVVEKLGLLSYKR